MFTDNLTICGKSAFDLWRLRRADQVDQVAGGQFTWRSCVSELDLRNTEDYQRSPKSGDLFRALRATGLPRPLDVAVSSKDQAFQSSVANCHVWSHAIPEGYVKQVAPGIDVCAPELALVQMASSLDYAALALLAYELCGTYVLVPTNECGGVEAVCNLEQRYDVDGLRKFVGTCHGAGVRGASKLSAALKDVLNGSNSPAETALALMLVAPRLRGGFGLRGLELNQRVDLSDEGRRIMYCSALRPDGFFPAICEAYELDSKTWHDSARAHENDSDRRAALKASGINAQSITSGQAYNLNKLTVIAEGFAGRLGLRLPPANRRMLNARDDLHERLFPGGSALYYAGHSKA